VSLMPLSKVNSLTNTPAHRVHVRGLATYLQPSGAIVLQEDNSALRVLAPDPNGFKVGDTLEAVGFISPGIFTPVLEDALIQPIAVKLQAEPLQVEPARVLWGNFDARLVSLTGIIQNHEATETNHTLRLLQDGVLFAASLDSAKASNDWAQLKKGDRVRVTGVCSLQGAQGAPQSFRIALRSPGDVVFVPRLREFSLQQVLMIIVGAVTVWGIVLLWGLLLRRRVQEQTRELARSLSLLNATIESTADGILVVDLNGRVTSHNGKFAEMWRLPPETLESRNDQELMGCLVARLRDGQAFVNKALDLRANPEAENFDTLELRDGSLFESFSKAQRLGDRCVGRVWCFRDVTMRKRAEVKLEAVNRQLLDTSRRLGMAEVATAVLHNVGNVLNSVNVSATLVHDRLQRSRATNLIHSAELIEKRMDNLELFLTQDPKGMKFRAYLKDLGQTLLHENEGLREEVESLRRNVEHIKTIVAMQQSYAQVSGTVEKLDPRDLMENAVQINGAAFERGQIQLVRDYKTVPHILVDRHKVLQILINLLSNARHALASTAPNERSVSLSIFPNRSERVCLRVSDNGVGIQAENLDRIFNQGFSTKKDGHGFGLHSGANAAKEMNGALSVQSDGPGKGAVFTLELPVIKSS